MKTSKFSEEQIAFASKQAETGTPVKEVIRKMGITILIGRYLSGWFFTNDNC